MLNVEIIKQIPRNASGMVRGYLAEQKLVFRAKPNGLFQISMWWPGNEAVLGVKEPPKAFGLRATMLDPLY